MEIENDIVYFYKISKNGVENHIGYLTSRGEKAARFKAFDESFTATCASYPGIPYKETVWYNKPTEEMKALQKLAIYEKEEVVKLKEKIEQRRQKMYVLRDRYLELKGELNNGSSKKM